MSSADFDQSEQDEPDQDLIYAIFLEGEGEDIANLEQWVRRSQSMNIVTRDYVEHQSDNRFSGLSGVTFDMEQTYTQSYPNDLRVFGGSKADTNKGDSQETIQQTEDNMERHDAPGFEAFVDQSLLLSGLLAVLFTILLAQGSVSTVVGIGAMVILFVLIAALIFTRIEYA